MVIMAHKPLYTAAEFRAFMKHSGLKGTQIARILGVSKTTVYGWKDKGVPRMAIMALMAHLMGWKPGEKLFME